MHSDINQINKARILSCYSNVEEVNKSLSNDIEKSGEGSKGGKVIGHTKSGKPIYEHPKEKEVSWKNVNKNGHKEFSEQDHRDAAKLYSKIADKEDDNELIGRYRSASQAHTGMADQKQRKDNDRRVADPSTF